MYDLSLKIFPVANSKQTQIFFALQYKKQTKRFYRCYKPHIYQIKQKNIYFPIFDGGPKVFRLATCLGQRGNRKQDTWR